MIIKKEPWDPFKARLEFPAFELEPLNQLAYLDSAATSQRLAVALNAERDMYLTANGNAKRGGHPLAEAATLIQQKARETVAEFCHVKSDQVIFTSSATASINLAAQSLEGMDLKGKIILTTELEHHSNFLPWMQLAQRKGASFEVLALAEDLDEVELQENAVALASRPEVALLAITAQSNVTGAAPKKLRDIIAAAKSVGAITLVDASQAVAHGQWPKDLWEADMVVFSAHKLYASLGTGVLIVRPEMLQLMKPSLFGGGMVATLKQSADHSWAARWFNGVEQFESGSQNTASLASLTAAIEHLKGWDRGALLQHEKALSDWTRTQLKRLPGITVIGSGASEGIVSFYASWAHAHDVGSILDAQGVCVRTGHHCAMPLMQSLKVTACVRASFGPYSTWTDARRLIEGVMSAHRRFK